MTVPQNHFLRFMQRCAPLSREEREALLQIQGETRTFASREQLYRTGDRAEGIHVVNKGWLAFSRNLQNGRRQVMSLHLPGDMVGIADLASPTVRGDLWSIGETEVTLIEKEDFGRFIEEHPRLASLMLILGENEKQDCFEWVQAVGRMDASEKLAFFLLDIHARLAMIDKAKERTFHMPMTQYEIGDYAGLTNVTVSKTFARFQSEKLIRLAYGQVTLLDPERLKALAHCPERPRRIDMTWFPGGREKELEAEQA